jgi:hypothetical protein
MPKFGKRPPKFHSRTLLLRDYLPKGVALPVPPVANGWEYAVSDATWGQSMLGNDSVGDCVEAMALQFIMAAQGNVGTRVTFTADQAIQLYSAITGYNPADPSTDQGTAITDLLAYWQATGIFGHKILGWAAVNPSDLAQVRAATYLFGGLLAGIQVTAGMMTQFQDGQAWNAPFSGEVEGGHGVPILGYGRLGQSLITWAKRQQCDVNFWEVVDELYCVVTQDWIDAQGKSPSGLDLATLQTDLQALAA